MLDTCVGWFMLDDLCWILVLDGLYWMTCVGWFVLDDMC